MASVTLIFLISITVLVVVFLLFWALDLLKSKLAERSQEKVRSQSLADNTQHLDKKPLIVPIRNDLELLRREPFASNIQECLVIVLSNESKTAGVCAYLNDLEVDYFVEDFPPCCQRYPNEHALRSFLGAMNTFSDKWVYAEAVTYLHNDFDLIKSVNTQGTRHARLVGKYEAKYYYRVIPQWTENFVCDNIELEEYWENMVEFTKRLLKASEFSSPKLWKRFPLNHWKRKQIFFKADDFHQVPHPGAMDNIRRQTPNLLPQVQEETTAVLVPID
ncbi:hypothetical protein TCAL_05748 [Tigriopus californicus]|uniref:Uncharacterized protein n=1 Tax=Tigriopus californicus TaxID=6832 RepID=A0A553N6A0_TIGCA|nr:uncharacterized protein LOC131885488 [Tigriopus californicus]TRY60959.1 hypothetical protein TCAL_05748 [Tigriopus californicus]|eukprot:TCALIF_05748-PA protein Name:"Protein of unknown function" AED:0.00 eAED:0.00 QI:40/1/1/1/1/1/3/408/274